jgi:hypothetical protein
VRLVAVTAFAFLIGCSPTHGPADASTHDATTKPWYPQTVQQLAALNREAEGLFQSGKSDEAAAIIKKSEPLMSRILSVPRPTLAATEAASDLDQLYGRMLLSNRHYGWARLQFQKNLARWQHWTPKTPETARRLQQAESAVAECDRRMAE